MNRRHLLLGGAGLAAGAAALGATAWATMGSIDDATAAANRARTPLPVHPSDRDLIRQATLAANGHNTQPWRFRALPDRIDILPDFSRRTPAVDPDDHHLFVSLGCAAENLAIAATSAGLGGQLLINTDGTATFFKGHGRQGDPELAAAIPLRQSTRSTYDGQALLPLDLRKLEAAVAVPGVTAVFITERSRLNAVRDLVLAGNSAQMADRAFVRELRQWIRFSPARAVATGDGLFGPASGNPALPQWLGSRMFGLVFTEQAENDKYARQLDSSAGVLLLAAEQADPAGWMAVGRACQRFMLQATALGVRSAFVNQPVEVPSLRPELAELAGWAGKRPDLLLRFGRAPALPYSLRRPVDQVIL